MGPTLPHHQVFPCGAKLGVRCFLISLHTHTPESDQPRTQQHPLRVLAHSLLIKIHANPRNYISIYLLNLMTAKVLYCVLFFVLFAFGHIAAQTVPTINCGNGRIDPGEECDPLADGTAPECCTSTCQYAPEANSCFGGLGICQLGKCLTRASECASLGSGATFLFRQPINGATSASGPWASCAANPPNQPSVQQVLSSDSGVAGVSLLTQLLPAPLAAQASCSRQCQGTDRQSGATVCADFGSVLNVNPATANYLPCIVDYSDTANLQEFVDSTDSRRNYEGVLMEPGVCITGVCRPDLCSATRCNNRGRCLLSNDALETIDSALGIDSRYPTSPTYSLGRCACDSGWEGTHCDIPTQDNDGLSDITDPENDLGDDCISYAAARVEEAILISVLCTAAACVILFLLIVLCVRSLLNKDSEDEDDEDTIAVEKAKAQKAAAAKSYGMPAPIVVPLSRAKGESDDASKKSISPLGDLEELPRVPVVSKFDLNVDGELVERASSISEKSVEVTEANAHLGNRNAALVNPGLASSGAVAAAAAAIASHDSQESQVSHEPTEPSSVTSPGNSSTESSPPNVLMPANYLRAAYAYNARLADEIHLVQGDILYLIKAYDDGWAKAYNLRSGKEGIFPLSFTKRIVLKDASESIQNFAKGGVFSGDSAEEGSESGASVQENANKTIKTDLVGK